jgi:hypothetical protein
MTLTEAINALRKETTTDPRAMVLYRRYNAWLAAEPRIPQPGDPKWDVGWDLSDQVQELTATIKEEKTMTQRKCMKLVNDLAIQFMDDDTKVDLGAIDYEHLGTCTDCQDSLREIVEDTTVPGFEEPDMDMIRGRARVEKWGIDVDAASARAVENVMKEVKKMDEQRSKATTAGMITGKILRTGKVGAKLAGRSIATGSKATGRAVRRNYPKAKKGGRDYFRALRDEFRK